MTTSIETITTQTPSLTAERIMDFPNPEDFVLSFTADTDSGPVHVCGRYSGYSPETRSLTFEKVRANRLAKVMGVQEPCFVQAFESTGGCVAIRDDSTIYDVHVLGPSKPRHDLVEKVRQYGQLPPPRPQHAMV